MVRFWSYKAKKEISNGKDTNNYNTRYEDRDD